MSYTKVETYLNRDLHLDTTLNGVSSSEVQVFPNFLFIDGSLG